MSGCVRGCGCSIRHCERLCWQTSHESRKYVRGQWSGVPGVQLSRAEAARICALAHPNQPAMHVVQYIYFPHAGSWGAEIGYAHMRRQRWAMHALRGLPVWRGGEVRVDGGPGTKKNQQ